MRAICRDLAAEGQALDHMVASIGDADWNRKTPFAGWTVKDEIAHIAYFDRMARLSGSDRKAFDTEMKRLMSSTADPIEFTMRPGRSKSNRELLEWWRTERKAMIEAYLSCDPGQRLPWQIPMSARSSATARLMETWAHGQDVADALGITRTATDRLRHIAHLGVATFGWSFRVRGLEKPAGEVSVILKGPSGDQWAWGPEDAPDSIRGDALDFCLVVVQRRHFKDTGLKVAGNTAEKWMSVAQVFAGPPEKGPTPGTLTG